MNECKVAFARRRQVRSRGSQMVRRGSLGGRETVVGDQRGNAPPPQKKSPPPSLHPVCLPSFPLCLLPLPVRRPPSLDGSVGRGLARLPGSGSLRSQRRRRRAVFLSVFWWADEESAGPHRRDEGPHFFHRSALDRSLSPRHTHGGSLTRRFPFLFIFVCC